MLLAVEQKRLRRARKTADLRIPQTLPGRGIPGFDVRAIAEEQQSPRGREQPRAAAVDLFPPRYFPGLVVDRHDIRPPRQVRAAARSTQAHGPAWIGIHQVADAERVLLMHVE